MFTGRLSDLIDDRPDEGIFRVSRAIFDDPAVFDLEMRQIFEGGWVFLGIADQARDPHDFFTTDIGRVPVLVSRDGNGALAAFINSCPHRGSRVAQTLAGGLIATVQGCIIFIFAPFVGVPLKPLNVLATIGVMLVLGIGLTGLGLTIAARMTSFEGFGTVNNFIVLPLYFLSGAQFPVQNVPDWMRVVIRVNPLYYGVEVMRGLLIGLWNRSGWIDFAVLAVFTVVTLSAATWSFTRQE